MWPRRVEVADCVRPDQQLPFEFFSNNKDIGIGSSESNLSAIRRFDRIPILVFAVRLHSPSNFDRRTTNHALPLTGASFFAPANNPVSQGNLIDLQGVAHGLERERSGSPVVEDPEPGFPELLPSARMARFEIVLKTSHRIDKDTGHQSFDRLN